MSTGRKYTNINTQSNQMDDSGTFEAPSSWTSRLVTMIFILIAFGEAVGKHFELNGFRFSWLVMSAKPYLTQAVSAIGKFLSTYSDVLTLLQNIGRFLKIWIPQIIKWVWEPVWEPIYAIGNLFVSLILEFWSGYFSAYSNFTQILVSCGIVVGIPLVLEVCGMVYDKPTLRPSNWFLQLAKISFKFAWSVANVAYNFIWLVRKCLGYIGFEHFVNFVSNICMNLNKGIEPLTKSFVKWISAGVCGFCYGLSNVRMGNIRGTCNFVLLFAFLILSGYWFFVMNSKKAVNGNEPVKP
jgi:hypothetical protein